MVSKGSRLCEPAGEQADGSDENPCDTAFDARLEVLGQPAAAAKPGEGALHHPPAGQHHKALRAPRSPRSFDDVDCPAAEFGQSVAQLVALLGAISKEVAQPRIKRADGGENIDGAVAVLNVGGLDGQ